MTKDLNRLKSLQDWQVKALKLRQQGYKSRAIAQEVLGRKTAKSSVNYFFADYDNGKYDVVVDLPVDKVKPLFYDIETSLAKSYHWGQWGQNLSQKQKIQESHLLSHAWAFGDEDVKGSILTQKEMLDHDPERLVLEAWSLLDNCSVLVAHNAKRYDVRKVNAYFLQYGLPPTSPYKVIDTLQIAKSKFNLPFNSLSYLAEFLGVQQKIDTGGIDLWVRCDKGDQEALDEMLQYNIGDIHTLRDVYNRLIGWDNNGVDMSVYSDHGCVCTNCASDNIVSVEGKFAYTAKRKYALYKCKGCGANLRGTKSEGVVNKLVRVI